MNTLFEVAIILHPSENDYKSKSKLLLSPSTFLAKSRESAALYAAKQIPDDLNDRLDDIEILVKPFECSCAIYENGSASKNTYIGKTEFGSLSGNILVANGTGTTTWNNAATTLTTTSANQMTAISGNTALVTNEATGITMNGTNLTGVADFRPFEIPSTDYSNTFGQAVSFCAADLNLNN